MTYEIAFTPTAIALPPLSEINDSAEVNERLIIKAHRGAIYLLDGPGKELDIIQYYCDVIIHREGGPSAFEHRPEIHLLVNHL